MPSIRDLTALAERAGLGRPLRVHADGDRYVAQCRNGVIVVADGRTHTARWDDIRYPLPLTAGRGPGVFAFPDGEASITGLSGSPVLAAALTRRAPARWKPPFALIAVPAAVVLVAAGIAFAIANRAPSTPEDLAAVCEGDGIHDAAPYEGAGPHKIAVITPTDRGEFGPYPLPPEWTPSRNDETALTLCATGRPSHATGDCDYGSGSHQLHAMEWTIEVREAATGDIVTTTTILADTPLTCPFVIRAGYPDPHQFTSEPTPQQILDVITTPVTARR